MQKTIVKTTLAAPSEAVWKVLSAVGGVDQWSPVINTCRIESSVDRGLQRICGSDQGELREKILKLDHEDRILRYAITEQPFLPVRDLVTTVVVTNQEGKASVSTTVTYRLNEGASAEEVEAAMTRIYTDSYQGIEALVTAAA